MDTEQAIVVWQQGYDKHTWNARLGDVYKLRVSPSIDAMNTIRYCAELCNVALDELAIETDLYSVDEAKRRAVYLAWRHNYALGDALMGVI